MLYGTSVTTFTIQRVILRSAATFVVPTSLLASLVANVVHSRPKAHQASVMGCISVQGAVWKDALAVVGDLWNPCSAGPCKFYVAIIIGQCARSKVAGLTYLRRSQTGEFYLSSIVHYICTSNHLTHTSGILNNNMTSVFEAGIAIQQWRAEVNKVRDLSAASCGPIGEMERASSSCRVVLYVTPAWRSLMRYKMLLSCTARNVVKVIVSCTLPRRASTPQKLSPCTKSHKNKVHGTNFISARGRLQTRRQS
jgi:hypothetical protein